MRGGKLTRNDVPRVHGILVLDEAEAVHELDLGDLASAMGCKVAFNIGLGGCGGWDWQSATRIIQEEKRWDGVGSCGPAECVQQRSKSIQSVGAGDRIHLPGRRTSGSGEHTVARKVPQVEAGGRHLSHDARYPQLSGAGRERLVKKSGRGVQSKVEQRSRYGSWMAKDGRVEVEGG